MKTCAHVRCPSLGRRDLDGDVISNNPTEVEEPYRRQNMIPHWGPVRSLNLCWMELEIVGHPCNRSRTRSIEKPSLPLTMHARGGLCESMQFLGGILRRFCMILRALKFDFFYLHPQFLDPSSDSLHIPMCVLENEIMPAALFPRSQLWDTCRRHGARRNRPPPPPPPAGTATGASQQPLHGRSRHFFSGGAAGAAGRSKGPETPVEVEGDRVDELLEETRKSPFWFRGDFYPFFQGTEVVRL